MRIDLCVFRKALSILLTIMLVANAYVPLVGVTHAAEPQVSSIKVDVRGDVVEHAYGDAAYHLKYYKKLALKVMATLLDGTTSDVTNNATFTSSDEELVVSSNGTVTATAGVDGFITITYQNKQALVELKSFWDYVSGTYAIKVLDQPVYADVTFPEVVFQDSNLEKSIRKQLNKYIGTITRADMEKLTILDASYQGIASLAGLEHAVNLEELFLQGNQIKDLAPVQHLTQLKKLSIAENHIKDLAPLSGLKGLTELYAGKNQITSLAPIANLVNLVTLDLQGNQVANLAPLADLTSLSSLNVHHNQIDNLSALAKLSSLLDIDISVNQVKNLQVLAELSGLQWTSVRGNPLSPEALTVLQQLEEKGVFVENTEYDATVAQFEDANLERALSEHLNLTLPMKKGDLRNVPFLDLSNQGIKSLKGLEFLQELEYINLSSNSIQSMDEFITLSQLDWVEMNRNPLQTGAMQIIEQLEQRENPVYISYDLGYNPTPVTIEDTNLERYLQEVYELTTPITKGDLLKLDYLFITNEDITSLKGLEHASNLIGLTVWGNRLTSIKEVQSLEQLEYLDVTRNPLDTSEGSEADQIFKTLEAKEATVLYDEQFVGTPVEIVDPHLLNALTENPGVQLTKGDIDTLTSLSLTYKGIVRLDGIEHATSVKSLNLSENRITDLTPLKNMKQLTDLYLNQNNIRDLSPLLELTNLRHVEVKNNLFDATVNSPARNIITLLQERGVTVVFNPVSDVIVKGKLVDENGPITKFSYISGSGFQRTAWDDSGEFSIKVSEGTYKVSGINLNNHQEYYPLDVPFEVRDRNLYVDGKVKDNLEIYLSSATLKGSVVDEYGVPIEMYSTVYMRKVGYETNLLSYTEADGKFVYRLADGHYVFTGVYTGNEHIQFNTAFEIKAGKLYVNGVLKESLDLQLPASSLKGIVVDENGVPWANANVSVEGNSLRTNSLGHFSARLADGDYRITHVSGEYENISVNIPFQIKAGKLYVNGELKESLVVTVPAITFKGQLVDDKGLPVPKASLGVAGAKNSYWTDTNENGQFSLRLPNGQYRLNHISYGNESAPQNLPFEIKDGKMYVNGQLKEQLDIKLKPVTVKGKLVDEHGVAVSNGYISVTKDSLPSFGFDTDSQGNFSLRLEDGIYTFNNFWKNGTSIALNIPFEVKGGLLYVDGKIQEQVLISLPPVTLLGSLMDENGLPVADASVSIEGNYRFFNAQTDSQGKFSLRLPDGTYKLTNVRFGTEAASPQFLSFDIKDGKLYIDGKLKEWLEIKLSPVTVVGKVVDENGTPLPNIYIEFNNSGRSFGIYTDNQGNFALRIEDGTYKATYLWNSQESAGLSLNMPFQVQNGKLFVNGEPKEQLEIKLPSISLKGRIVDEKGSPVVSGYVYFQDHNRGYDAKIDSQGTFTHRLNDGQYRLTRVSIGNEVAPQDINFEIKEGKLYVGGELKDQLEIKLLPVSVIGKLVDENNQIISNASILVSNNQNGQGFEFSPNSFGKFGLRLSDGIYRVSSIWYGQQFITLNSSFEVQNGKLYINGQLNEELTIQLLPLNFKGQITYDNGAKVDSGYLSLRDYTNNHWHSLKINTDGSFSGRLPDGHYHVYKANDILVDYWFSVIDGKINVDNQAVDQLNLKLKPVKSFNMILKDYGQPISDASIFVGYENASISVGFRTNNKGIASITLQDGSYRINSISKDGMHTSLKKPVYFNIKDGKIFVNGVEKAELVVEVNQVSVTTPSGLAVIARGKNTLHLSWDHQENADYYKVYRSLTEDGKYESVSWVPNNEFKDYGLELATTYYYKVVAVNSAGESGYSSVVSGTTTDGMMKGKLVKGAQPLTNLVFSLYSLGHEEKWYDFKTDDNGEFLLELPDGVYKIEGIWDDPTWYYLNKSFTVSDGMLDTDLMIDVEAITHSIFGTLTDAGSPMSNLIFSIRSTTGAEKWYDTVTDVDGHFAFDLPDGSYLLEGIWDDKNSKWYVMNRSFTVKWGKVVGEAELLLDVNPPVTNEPIYGTLAKGDAVLADTVFSIRTTSGPEIWYDTKTDSNGRFAFNLPDGNYLIVGIWLATTGEWFELNQSFTVAGGKLIGAEELLINVKPVVADLNVVGTLKKGAEVIPHTVFSIRTSTGAEIWYDTKTDASGGFGFNLPDGNYVIVGIWVASTGEWFELNQTFTVAGGSLVGAAELIINVKPEVSAPLNVSGTVKKGTEPVAGTIFSLRTTTGQEIWYDTQTDANGRFALNLPNGTYIIEGIWIETENKWYPLKKEFTVDGTLELEINI